MQEKKYFFIHATYWNPINSLFIKKLKATVRGVSGKKCLKKL